MLCSPPSGLLQVIIQRQRLGRLRLRRSQEDRQLARVDAVFSVVILRAAAVSAQAAIARRRLGHSPIKQPSNNRSPHNTFEINNLRNQKQRIGISSETPIKQRLLPLRRRTLPKMANKYGFVCQRKDPERRFPLPPMLPLIGEMHRRNSGPQFQNACAMLYWSFYAG